MSVEPMSLRIHPPVPQRLNELPTPRGLRVRFDALDVDRRAAAWSRVPCADTAPPEAGEVMRIPVK